MPDKLLLNMDPATALTGSESVYGVQNGKDVQISPTQMATLAASRVNPTNITLGNIGTRTLDNRLGSLDNSVSQTYQVTMAINQPFDAVRLVTLNTVTNIGVNVLAASASVISATTDLNNSAGTWQPFLKYGANKWCQAIAPAVDRPVYQFSDWLYLKSIPRTDGGTFPLLVVRAIFDGINGITAVGNGTDGYTNWATKPDGNIWVMRQQAGNFITTPTGFTSTTNVNQTPIFGVQFLSRGKIINVGAVGDSEIGGRSTYLGEGFVLPMVQALNNSTAAISYANFGWAAQLSNTYTARAIDILDTPLRPDVMFFITGSPNDISTTIAATDIQSQAGRFQMLIAKCKEVGTIPIALTWLPSNTAIKNYGASDSLRVAENQQVLSMFPNNSADAAAAVSGVTTGGQVQFAVGMTSDDLHPNDAGNAAITAAITPKFKAAVGL